MGSDGKPVRKVTIAGEDYGKIWQMLHIYNNPWMLDGNYITSFKLFTRFGVGFGIETAGAFVSEILTKIINPFIDQMSTNAKAAVGGNSPLKKILDAVQTQGGSISPFGSNNWAGGSVYDLLTQYGDIGEWNELYIEDQKTGPVLVYRPNPWLVAGGDPTNAGAYINGNDPSTIKVNSITMDDVLSIDVTRTDRHVANYFWVESPAYDLSFELVGKAFAAQGARDTFILDTYGNCDPSLYGFKQMTAQTNQGSPLVSGGNGTPKPINDRDGGLTRNWITARRTALAASNKDNVVFETGTMRIAGNENVKAGSYLMVTHGNMTSAYYVVAVRHHFVPFGQYSTMVTFERGTGFIDRVQRGGGAASPYYSEWADAQK